MGEKAKVILNEHNAKSLLKRDTLDLDKFYTADLKMFIKVAKEEINRLNNIINELENLIYDNDSYLSDDFLNSFDKIIEKGND